MLTVASSFIFTEHENWFGSDEVLGPLAISIRKELMETSHENLKEKRYLYRLIVRSTEVSKKW